MLDLKYLHMVDMLLLNNYILASKRNAINNRIGNGRGSHGLGNVGEMIYRYSCVWFMFMYPFIYNELHTLVLNACEHALLEKL